MLSLSHLTDRSQRPYCCWCYTNVSTVCVLRMSEKHRSAGLAGDTKKDEFSHHQNRKVTTKHQRQQLLEYMISLEKCLCISVTICCCFSPVIKAVIFLEDWWGFHAHLLYISKQLHSSGVFMMLQNEVKWDNQLIQFKKTAAKHDDQNYWILYTYVPCLTAIKLTSSKGGIWNRTYPEGLFLNN